MTNHHRKGSIWRHKVDEWFSEAGFLTTARGIGYAGDDLLVEGPKFLTAPLRLSVEAKNCKEINLAGFVNQAVDQAASYSEELTLPVVVAHRRGRAEVDDAYVVMPGWAFIELVTR